MLLAESQYLPPISVFKNLIAETHVAFYLYDEYKKMSFRNRSIIPSANGLIHLSVPVEGGRQQNKPMKDVRIFNGEKWQLRHWRAITSAYNRSPWFEFYEDGLAGFYNTQYEFLFDWNIELFHWIVEGLGLTCTVETISALPPIEDLKDIRNTIRPATYVNVNPSEYPVYSQVFVNKIGFQPNVSIIDLLFCEGRNAKKILSQ
ncbi:MAG: WbqC family protein [Chitinophagaceae bacterium]|nr:WbqC family protein [Chitinophagaceae bacterium]